jgi:hypothetical protein
LCNSSAVEVSEPFAWISAIMPHILFSGLWFAISIELITITINGSEQEKVYQTKICGSQQDDSEVDLMLHNAHHVEEEHGRKRDTNL